MARQYATPALGTVTLPWLLVVLVCWGLDPGWAAGPIMEVEGTAVIRGGDLGRARLEARQNALREAALQGNIRVGGVSVSDLGRIVVDSVQVRSTALVRSAEVLGEQRQGDLLTLYMRVALGEAGDPCDFPAAAYRKRVATVYFPIVQPGQIGINDYFGYEKGIPAELARRLAATGTFLSRDESNLSLYQDAAQAPTMTRVIPDGRPAIVRLAEQLDVQFVVSGVIRDLGVQWETGLLAPLFDARATPRERRLEIEFFIHDTLTGELLARHKYFRSIRGSDLVPAAPVRFGTQAFTHNPFGQAFEQVLDAEVGAIGRLLQCRSFIMKVLDQRNGRLYLDAGAASRVRVGDLVTLYDSDRPGQVFGAAGQMEQFGWPKTSVRVVQVFPAYSVAEPEHPDSGRALIPGEYLWA